MKKILNLLTAFMAVIGVCTAALVCFIIIYTNINGGFTPKNDSHTLTDSTEDNFTQSIDANAEQSFSNINNDQYPPTSDNKKIHYPNCNDVTKIASENYSTSNLSISELKAQGYTTCGHCFR